LAEDINEKYDHGAARTRINLNVIELL